MKRFLPWLIPITLLLIGVPILLSVKVIIFAKVIGVLLVVLTTIALRFWLYNANKLRANTAIVKFTVNERFFLNEHFPLFNRLSKKDKSALEERAGLLLAEISFDRFDRKDVEKEECLVFAMMLAIVSDHLPYKTASHKIVVFKENNEPERAFQGTNPVLFVDVLVLRAQLKELKSLTLPQETTHDMWQMLLDFYEI